jgi:hypothetical protein
MSNNGFDPAGMKPHLSPTEALAAAYFHLVVGLDQHLIAQLYRTNPGRVNAAVAAAREAFGKAEAPISQSDMQVLKAVQPR